jgi:hypothetical protein
MAKSCGDELTDSALTQFQVECERLLTERLAEAGSCMHINRAVEFVEPVEFLSSTMRWLLPALFNWPPKPGKSRVTIEGTVEGTDIDFWIYEHGASFESVHGSQWFEEGEAEEFVDAVLEIVKIKKAEQSLR